MLILETFRPAWGLPDPSPFVTKTMVLLKMAGLEFKTRRGDPRKTPKGKLPVLHDNGTVIPDSGFIRRHLEQVHGIDFDAGLSAEQKAVGIAVTSMMEDRLYWAVVRERWLVDENFESGPKSFFRVVPAPIRPVIAAMIRRRVRRSLWSQGTGRHSREEVGLIAADCLGALADIIGDKPFLLGDAPSGADASAYAFAGNALCPQFTGPVREAAEAHPALQAYCTRMTERYFPDLAS